MGVDFWDREQWLTELDLEKTDIIVCTPQIFYNCLAHAYLTMDDVSLLIIDECHHARKKHPLNVTLMHFYHTIGGGMPRPKILGLTASPIWNPVDPLKSLEELESNLQASIIAVKYNMEELNLHSKKPQEIVEYYRDAMDSEPSTLYRALQEMEFEGVEDASWDSIQTKAIKALQVLGQLGQDYFLSQLYGAPVEKLVRSAAFTLSTTPEKLVELEKAHEIIQRVEGAFPQTLHLDELSPKVFKLVDILNQYRINSARATSSDSDAGFQCIVFVTQRHIAFGLTWMLERVDSLKGWLKIKALVGHGTKSSLEGQSQDFKKQQDTVKDFKNGKYNILISTA